MELDGDTIGLIIVAIINAYTAYVSTKTRAIAQKTETNTNSMKDQLMAATAISSHAEGREEGRAEGERKAAILAQDQKQQ